MHPMFSMLALALFSIICLIWAFVSFLRLILEDYRVCEVDQAMKHQKDRN